ncbi:MAG: hypothetical protein JJU02_16910 [Cryomorphaceae bacterium]|nr:hypothetical protein [Cryomorphaceae bacterium]
MRNLLFTAFTVLMLHFSMMAQTTKTHTVIADNPEFKDICNLYVNPMFILDAPMYGVGLDEPFNMDGLGMGLGIRAHAIIGENLQADFNIWRSWWPARTYNLEAGGVIITSQKVRRKEMIVIISQRETGRTATTVSTETNYLKTTGNELRFTGFRGGILHYRSFYNSLTQEGHSNSFGFYAGRTVGFIRNLQVKLIDGRKREHTAYHRYYFDVMVAYTNYNWVKGEARGIPVGLRFGRETNNPLSGLFATVTNLEIGYRPGLAGFYIGMAFSPVSVRQKMAF